MTMSRQRLFMGGGLVLLLAAYTAGYWPERQRRVVLEQDVAVLRPQLAEAAARLRTARLLGDLLNLRDATAAMNYGQAQTLSSRLFDGVRDEAGRSPLPEVRAALNVIRQDRDVITAALARGDGAALEQVRAIEVRLRQALGYPVVGLPGT